MTKEGKDLLKDYMSVISLTDCFNRFSDPNNHELRIALEVIQYLMGFNNYYDYLKNVDEIVIKFKKEYPGLATEKTLFEIEKAAYDYFDEFVKQNPQFSEIK